MWQIVGGSGRSIFGILHILTYFAYFDIFCKHFDKFKIPIASKLVKCRINSPQLQQVFNPVGHRSFKLSLFVFNIDIIFEESVFLKSVFA